MDIWITIGTVYGISAIITMSKIFEPIRIIAARHSPNFWRYLTSCMQCLPFWVGIFVSVFMGTPVHLNQEILPEFLHMFFTYLFTGAFFSGVSFLIHTIHKRFNMINEGIKGN